MRIVLMIQIRYGIIKPPVFYCYQGVWQILNKGHIVMDLTITKKKICM